MLLLLLLPLIHILPLLCLLNQLQTKAGQGWGGVT